MTRAVSATGHAVDGSRKTAPAPSAAPRRLKPSVVEGDLRQPLRPYPAAVVAADEHGADRARDPAGRVDDVDEPGADADLDHAWAREGAPRG